MASQFRELAAQNPAILQNIIQRAAGGNPALAGLTADQLMEIFLNEGAPVIQVTAEERAAIERVGHLF